MRVIGAVPWPLCRLLSVSLESSSGSLLNGSKILVGMYIAHAILEQYALLGVRARREDETLYKEFGDEWISYSTKVPWMFLPYVI